MLNANELLSLTVTTMNHEDAWLSVKEAIRNAPEDELRYALEEMTILAAGMAVVLSGFQEEDVLKVIDFHTELLNAGIEAQEEN
jgi:hypothetical protein